MNKRFERKTLVFVWSMTFHTIFKDSLGDIAKPFKGLSEQAKQQVEKGSGKRFETGRAYVASLCMRTPKLYWGPIRVY